MINPSNESAPFSPIDVQILQDSVEALFLSFHEDGSMEAVMDLQSRGSLALFQLPSEEGNNGWMFVVSEPPVIEQEMINAITDPTTEGVTDELIEDVAAKLAENDVDILILQPIENDIPRPEGSITGRYILKAFGIRNGEITHLAPTGFIFLDENGVSKATETYIESVQRRKVAAEIEKELAQIELTAARIGQSANLPVAIDRYAAAKRRVKTAEIVIHSGLIPFDPTTIPGASTSTADLIKSVQSLNPQDVSGNEKIHTFMERFSTWL